MIWFWLILAFILIGCLIHDSMEHNAELKRLQDDQEEAMRILSEHFKRTIERIERTQEERRRG